MTQSTQQLRIIAEPKAFYRERYKSEQYKNGNRAQRHIRAEKKNQFELEYPTVEVKKSILMSISIYTEKKFKLNTSKHTMNNRKQFRLNIWHETHLDHFRFCARTSLTDNRTIRTRSILYYKSSANFIPIEATTKLSMFGFFVEIYN